MAAMTGHGGDDAATRLLTKGLAAELHHLYQRIGASLDELSAASKRNRQQHPEMQELSRSTIYDILRGARTKPPTRTWFTSFITTSILVAQERKVELGEAGRVEYWVARYNKTIAALDATVPLPAIQNEPALTVMPPSPDVGLRSPESSRIALEDNSRKALL